MSEFELVSLAIAYREAAFSHLMDFIYILFGYLVVAYLVGQKLTNLQLSIVTTLFTIFSLSAAWMVFQAFGMHLAYSHAYVQASGPNLVAITEGLAIPTRPPHPNTSFLTFLLTLGAYFAAILFMHHQRRPAID